MARDDTLLGGKWVFDADVTEVFDDMLARSIPSYDDMRAVVFEAAKRFVVPGTNVVDLGASRGAGVACLIEHCRGNRFVLCEVSQPMLQAAGRRFAREIAEGTVEVRDVDLRHDFPRESASVFLSVLTLQFIPIEYRQRIVRDVYEHLLPGGAFILVEKVLGATNQIDTMMLDAYHDLKRRNGYGQAQIDRKKMSLEGVLVPITDQWNRDLLSSAGFVDVDCIWRWMNFAGWVAVKR